MSLVNMPLFLTLIRMFCAPTLVPFFIVHSSSFACNLFAAALFLFFGITDFLDGYLARRYGMETKIGAVLDPLADKFLMYSSLVALLAVNKISYIWVLILIGREFFVLGIRQIAYEYNLQIAVSSWGKLKTFLHIFLVTWIIANPYHAQGYKNFWNIGEAILLFFALISSVGSALNYYVALYKKL